MKNIIIGTFIAIIIILAAAVAIAAPYAGGLFGNGILNPASTWLVVMCCLFVFNLFFCIAVQNDTDESILDAFILTFIGAIFTVPVLYYY